MGRKEAASTMPWGGARITLAQGSSLARRSPQVSFPRFSKLDWWQEKHAAISGAADI
jgi:hypothetical protein